MILPRFNLKAWQLVIWDFLGVVKSYLGETLITQNNAIYAFPSASSSYRYTRNSIKPEPQNTLATLSTYNAHPVIPTLPIFSNIHSPSTKPHSKLPPSYTWRQDEIGNYWYRSNNEWTGILIKKIVYLWIPKPNSYDYARAIRLKYPSFCILFKNGGKIFPDLAGFSSLKEAQKVAEWYYKEWLKTKQKYAN